MERDQGAVSGAPKQLLSVSDGIVLLCGMVIGAGIFKAPSIVAGNTPDAAGFMLVWLARGGGSPCGALGYAQLSARYPRNGGG